jgi:hypothetical protein
MPSIPSNALPPNKASRLRTTIAIIVALPTVLLLAHVRNQDKDLPSRVNANLKK